MDSTTAARYLALGRIGVGATLLAAPQLLTRTWVGADGPGIRMLGNVVGIRDLVVGLGQFGAITRGEGARPWLAAGAACDFVDLAATLRARDDLPLLGVIGTAAMATTGAIAGAYLQTQVK